MLYVEEKSFSRQIDVLECLISIGSYEVILWLYPEAKIGPCGLKLAPEGLKEGEQVTTYSDGSLPHRTLREKLTNELLNIIRVSAGDVIENCDSIVLYQPGTKEWAACTIGHEGMVLVRDADSLVRLKGHGFKASEVKPDWW